MERPEKQIQYFSDESAGASATSTSISTSSFGLKGVDSSVVFLGVIPATSAGRDPEDCFDLLVIHKDGHARRLAPDLSEQKWCFLPSTISSGEHNVHAAFLVDFEDARKSLLRRRQDIIASILGADPGSTSTDTSSILLVITHPTQATSLRPNDVQVQLFSVPVADRTDAFSLRQTHQMTHLMTMKLPGLENQEDLSFQNPKWDFHSGSAGLSLSFGRGFITYDLSQYAPSISSRLVVGNEQFQSLIRISPRSVIGAGQSSIAIYDTQYQSIQANIMLKASDLVGVPKSADQKASIIFVAYFSKLRLAIGLCGNILFGLDVTSSNALQPTSLKRPRDGLLINAIGRGTGSTAEKQMDTIKEKKKLDALAESGDHAEFDRLMKSELGQPVKEEIHRQSSDLAPSYNMPSRDDFVDPEKIFYLLSKIFSFQWDDEAMREDQGDNTALSSQLFISMLPHDTFIWLLDTGRLSVDNIEIALRRSNRPQILPSLSGGALMLAVREFDPSLELLLLVLNSPVELSSDELTHALRIFLEVAHSTTLDSVWNLRDNPDGPDRALECLQSFSGRLTEAPTTLLTAPFSPLNLALAKLHTQPLRKVTQSLRSILSNSETISIIHHLRHALAMGGYTSRFTENLPFTSTNQKPDGENNAIKPPILALNTIIDLLTACVDAVGPMGWISATPTNSIQTPDNVVADMKSEISAALAGVEEASYLKGILREFIRCAGTGSETTSNQQQEAEKHHRKGIKHEKLNGADLLTFPTGTAMDIDGEDDDGNDMSNPPDGRILPLSLKMSHSQDHANANANTPSANDEGTIVSKTKVRKSTGEVLNRSNREIGYLKRKAVGKYSFERIIV